VLIQVAQRDSSKREIIILIDQRIKEAELSDMKVRLFGFFLYLKSDSIEYSFQLLDLIFSTGGF